ncbi:MAG TPA: NAD-dependent epimerase/dehydratase family protein [Nocardioidaceae bacterium]|nr:NAD-dependent epimerase/dehydratase family protein [Nocardioidaceae bacterium]
MGQVVLVTGVSSDFGGRFARRIAADPSVDRVVGVDVVPPRADLGRVSFVRADIRNPVIAKVVAGQDVDTVVHLSVQPSDSSGAGRSSMKEHNVIGTMQLLAACQRAPGLERLVVRSSAAVYGSSSADPAMFTEDMSAKRLPRTGFGKDVLEVEGYVRGFTRRRPDVNVTLLRPASVVGPGVSTRLTDYFRLPVVPTVLGYDARLQFVHDADLLGALHHATVDGVHGTFNVAGSGVLMLSQAMRRLGRPTVSVPGFALSAAGTLGRQAGVRRLSPELATYLRFGRGLDTRRLRTVLGFTPGYTTPSAFADFAASVRAPSVRPPSPAPAPRVVVDTGADHG